VQLPLPGLQVPLLDPGAQSVAAADDPRDARHSHPGMELVVGVNELRHEAINLAPIEDFVPLSRQLQVPLRHHAIIRDGKATYSAGRGSGAEGLGWSADALRRSALANAPSDC
jgi:hypothetical protein